MPEATGRREKSQPQRFRPYPEYRDTGVEWLGKIPAHWKVKRLKYLATMNDEVLPESTGPNTELNYVDIGSVDSVVGITTKEPFIFEKAPSRARRIVRDGDVIISTVRTYLRAIAAIESPEPNLIVSTGFAVVRPRQLQNSFASYALRAPEFVERVVAHSVGVSYPAINANELSCFAIAYPKPDEQRLIATFLDRETAKIDALVAKKERLIELLQEKRTALITRAVTRGLHPNVPTKDSGVAWLGEIPAHWEVKKVTWLFRIGSGTTPRSEEPAYYGGQTPWVTTSELRESLVTETEKNVTAKAFRDYTSLKLHPAGSIAVAMYGATIGRLGVLGVPATVNQACCVFSHPRNVNPWYWFYWLQMRRPYLIALGYGGGQPNLSQQLLSSIRASIPPRNEQNEIVEHLDAQAAMIDLAIAKIRHVIYLLDEYRTALISAAVTGKIDVQNKTA